MFRRNAPYFLLLAIVAVFAWFFWHYSDGKGRYDWKESGTPKAYKENNDQPYGTSVLHRFLEGYFPAGKTMDIEKSLFKELPLDESGRSNYVFVGESMFLDSTDTRHLMAFVEKGNTAFISSKTIPYDLFNYLYVEECEEAYWDDYAAVWDTGVVFLHVLWPKMNRPQGYPVHFANRNLTAAYQWHFIENEYFCNSSGLTALGYFGEKKINFAQFNHGKGRFLLHTTPLAFSNYNLLEPEPQAYAAGVFSRLVAGNIYWDVFSRQAEYVGRRRNEQRGSSRSLPEKHALTYILEQRSLAWAWYLLMGMGLTWLVFRAKRRYRIIPVLPKNENNSLEFISIIANLHFREKNYQRLCMQKMKIYLAHLRERYGMQVSLAEHGLPRVDEAFMQRLAQVAQVPDALVRSIFQQYEAIVRYQPTEAMMTDFHLALERFYKESK